MKFRAVMRDPQCMRELQNIVLSLTKLSRTCVMNISKDHINFIVNEESSSSAPMVWVDIDVKLYFTEYNMESAKPQYPQIMLSMGTMNLGRAFTQLRSHNAKFCKFKLTNLQFPCLTVELEYQSQNSDNTRQMVHDVPVTVIPRGDWCYYETPQLPKCQLVLNMPLNRKIRGIIEKTKNLSPTIIFYATSNGELSLVCETELVTITTRCKKLEVREINQGPEDRGKDIIDKSCSVDCKKTSLLLNSLQVPTSEMSCGIDDDRLLHLEVMLRDGVTIHSIIPAVSIKEDNLKNIFEQKTLHFEYRTDQFFTKRLLPILIKMNDGDIPEREKRSFLVGRNASVDRRRFRPDLERPVKLFDGIENEDVRYTDDKENLNRTFTVENGVPLTCGSDGHETALVYLRMRPLKMPSPAYAIRGNALIVKPSSEQSSTIYNKNTMEKQFFFTDVFDSETPQRNVYENCVRTQIEGEEGLTLLTYGTSGSGKTYTLLGDETQPGMLPRAMEQIFVMYERMIYPRPTVKLINGRVTLVEDRELVPELDIRKRLLSDLTESSATQYSRSKIIEEHNFMLTKNNDCSVLIWVSFVEIYNEKIFDLLEADPTRTQTMAPPTRKNLKILGNDGKVFIKGATTVYVKSSIEALHLLRYGLHRLTYASTSINVNSSRSHCIFFIDVLKFDRSGCFTEISYKFCDLAGSERFQKTNNIGSRLKEAQHINTSLLVLGRCLDAATSSRKKGNDIIPFRESKLTMLLQAALLGKDKLTMIVNVMPTDKYYEENLNVLGFASIARNVIFKPPVIKQQKQRCSFILECSLTSEGNDPSEQLEELLKENIFLRSEVDRLMALMEEEHASHVLELFELEGDIRHRLTDSHKLTLYKIKKQAEERLRMELENQKGFFERKIERINRKHQWEIEDLREELKEENNTNRRQTI